MRVMPKLIQIEKLLINLNEINKFLDEKMKDDSLYQKSIKKIKSARRL